MSDLPEWNFSNKEECTNERDTWVYGYDDNENIDVDVMNLADAWIVDDLHYELFF